MDAAAQREFAGSAPNYMTRDPETETTSGPDPASDAPDDKTMWDPLTRAATAFKRVASSYALLAVLDMRRAAIQLTWIVGGGIVVTVLLVTAWLAAVVALAVWLLGQGMSWPAVLVVAALLNVVGAGLVVWRMRNVFEAAPFSATLRQLNVDMGDKGGAA